jgi:hypothetical protein
MEIEVSEKVRIDYADAQGISEECVRDNGGDFFCRLLLR